MTITYSNNGDYIFLEKGDFGLVKKKDALEESIRKWTWLIKYLKENRDNLLSGKILAPYTGSQACSLCHFYISNLDCKGCPVKKGTGMPECEGTPYIDYINSVVNMRLSHNEENYKDLLKYARQELRFLKSLVEKNA